MRCDGLTELPHVDIVYCHVNDGGVMVGAAVAAGMIHDELKAQRFSG